jgi:hypothetical protein
MTRRHGGPGGRQPGAGRGGPEAVTLGPSRNSAPGLPGDEAARRLQVVDSNAVRSHRVHALSVLASQLRSPQLMLLAVTVMAVVGQLEITG